MISKMFFPELLYILSFLCQANNFYLIFQIKNFKVNKLKNNREPLQNRIQAVVMLVVLIFQLMSRTYWKTVRLVKLPLPPVPTLSPSIRRSFTRHICTFSSPSGSLSIFSSSYYSSDPSFSNFLTTRTEITGRNCWAVSAARNSGPAARYCSNPAVRSSRSY